MTKLEFKTKVLQFAQYTHRMKKATKKYETLKQQFYSDANDFFNTEKIDGSIGEQFSYNDELTFVGNLQVKRVSPVKVTFDADKLEKVLPYELQEGVIQKQYSIVDIQGLIKYLKSCGVDAKVFKSFINVSKTVNEKELDRLSDLGELNGISLEGCYSACTISTYFKVQATKDEQQ